MDWFLYDNSLRHERVNNVSVFLEFHLLNIETHKSVKCSSTIWKKAKLKKSGHKNLTLKKVM